MKTLIIGRTYIADYFLELSEKYTVIDKYDLFNRQDDWENIFSEFDTIVNAHELKEGDLRDMLIENYMSVVSLMEFCEKYNKRFVQISSANFYARSHDWNKNTEELSELSIGSDYLLTKRIAERFLTNTNALVLRIKKPFDGRNHPDNWLVQALSRKRVYNWMDVHTYIPDIQEIIEDFSKNGVTGLFNAVQEEAGSDLYYLHQVLQLSRYAHLDVHMKSNPDIEDNPDVDPSFSDVNSSKIRGKIKLTPMVSAVILSWEKLKSSIVPELMINTPSK
jgi:nucleoside-diphosphate-sugar epimerase